MSGGSYNYLYSKDIDDLINNDSELQNMADDLAKLGYADDVARETQEFLLTIRQMKNRLKTMKDRLEDVWQSMEWWKSYDTSEEDFKKVLTKYRGGIKKEKVR